MSNLRNDQVQEQQASSQSTEKKPYLAPTLSNLGNVRAITQTGQNEGTFGSSQPAAA